MEWPSLKRKIQAPRQLLVEGRTPEIFFREWVEGLGLKDRLEVRDYGSISDLTDFLRLFTGLKEFREIVVSVGIIRDAESNPAAHAFAAICSSLRVVGIRPPDAANSFGDGTPRTGVFVLPDCLQSGMLETLCWSALEADPRAAHQLQCVKRYLDCLRANLVIGNEAKARVWSYLAGLGKFEPQVGRAAQAKIWDWSSPALQPLSTFLKSI